MSQAAVAYARSHAHRSIEDLATFVRFPSVSSQPGRVADVRRCAAWLAKHLERIGLPMVRMIDTARHPIVYAQSKAREGFNTVLVYGHYDVQPAEPLEAWRSPPFDPVIRGDELFGRGASDDKGQLLAHVKALEAYLAEGRALPLNVKCLFDGEEEIGSPSLRTFLQRNMEALRSDVVIMSDTRFLGPDRPALTYSLRGSLNLQLCVKGPRKELHSGAYGGAVANPIRGMSELIAGLHDERGRIAVPGIYRSVRPLAVAERAEMALNGPSDARILSDAGVSTGTGESGYSLYERTTARPALTVTSVTGGYQGDGIKTVIPPVCVAKINIRLVADQKAAEVENLFRRYVKRRTPEGVRTWIRKISSAEPAHIDRAHPALSAASSAYKEGFGLAPVFLRSGGTIPVVNLFEEILAIPTVLMGFALPTDGMHAPNEKFHLPNFLRGIETVVHFLDRFAGEPSKAWTLGGQHGYV